MKDQIEGTMQGIGGRIQDAVGGATGDVGTQLEGKFRQAAGSAQQTYGEALDAVREKALTNPVATLAVVAGVGFLLGALWARRD